MPSRPQAKSEIDVEQPRVKVPKEPRKKRRAKPGVAALREIRKQQTSIATIIPRAAMGRLIREIINDKTGSDGKPIRVKKDAFTAFQVALEEYIIETFQRGMLAAVKNKRRQLSLKDYTLALMLDPRNANLNFDFQPKSN